MNETNDGWAVVGNRCRIMSRNCECKRIVEHKKPEPVRELWSSHRCPHCGEGIDLNEVEEAVGAIQDAASVGARIEFGGVISRADNSSLHFYEVGDSGKRHLGRLVVWADPAAASETINQIIKAL